MSHQRPLLAFVICTGGAILVAAAFFVHTGCDITAFFRIGDRFRASPYLPPTARVFQREDGYDGQFFLAVAYDPLLENPRTLSAVENPRYRLRRVLYPVLGYLLALGRRSMVPWALVFINIVAAGALGAILASEAETLVGAWMAIPLGLQGLWVALLFSTADLVGAAFFLLALACLKKGRVTAAGVSLLLASLTREFYLVPGAAFALYELLKGRRRTGFILAALQVPPVAWNLGILFSVPAGSSGVAENFRAPFVGLFQAARSLAVAPPSARWVYSIFSLALLLSTAMWAAAAGLLHWRESPYVTIALMAYLVLVLMVSPLILGYFMGYTRVFLGLYALLWMWRATGRFGETRAVLGILSALASAMFLVNHLVLRPGG